MFNLKFEKNHNKPIVLDYVFNVANNFTHRIIFAKILLLRIRNTG